VIDVSDDHVPGSSASPMSTAAALSTEDETIVAAFNTVLEAEMARGRLEVDGIASRIVDGNTVGIAAHLSMALGGAKVVVAQRDLEAARAILFSTDAFDDDKLDEVALAAKATTAPVVVEDADSDALRALKAAVFGLVFVPPVGQLYSLLVLAGLARRRHELSASARRYAVAALAIDAAVLASVAAVLAAIF
jgi:hypothetical protein